MRHVNQVTSIPVSGAKRSSLDCTMKLKSSGAEESGRSRSVVNAHVVGDNQVAQNMRDFLLEEGVLLVDGGRYLLSREKISVHGINRAELRIGEMSSGVSEIVARFLNSLR